MSRRKRLRPAAEQLQERKRKKIAIKTKQVSLVALRHKVVSLWEHGANMDEFQFRPKQSKHIIQFMQATYPHYARYEAAKSFVFRALKRYKEAATTPHLEPHRDRRGENKKKTKRENPIIVEMVDELLSEPKATAPKVKATLSDRGFNISVQTIHRIAKDLSYRWTKPWYTDVLTPAQKYKRKLFCAKLLRMGAPALLHTISRWLFTDEKWWDIVGPSASRYVKAATKTEAKMGNQVCCFFVVHFLFCVTLLTLCCAIGVSAQEQKRRYQKKGLLLGRYKLVGQNARSGMDCCGQRGRFQTHEKFVCRHVI